MEKKLNCIMLIDDNRADNRYHQLVIQRMNIAEHVEVAPNGIEAIKFLKKENQVLPELIFLDINMPKMNGWEFIEAYKNIDPKQKEKVIIVILSTSSNSEDRRKAEQTAEITKFKVKPLTEKILTEIIEEHFRRLLPP